MAETGVIFPRKDAERIGRTVRAFEQQPTPLVGVPGGRADRREVVPVWVSDYISGQDGRLNGRQVKMAPGVSAASGALVSGDVGEASDEDDCILWDMDASPHYRMAVPWGKDTESDKPVFLLLPRGLFPVEVTQTGGSAGSSSAYCTFTYTVKTLGADITLGTGIVVNGHRYVKAEMNAAVRGMAFYNVTGGLELMWVDEYAKSTNC